MIIREWKCGDCSATFESSEDPDNVVCPHCTAVEPERVFLTAPAIRDGNTTRKDTILKELASDYGLSDMSNKHGQPVKQAPGGPAAPSFGPNTQVMQKLHALGNAGDNFSGVGSALAGKGPRTWNKVKAAG